MPAKPPSDWIHTSTHLVEELLVSLNTQSDIKSGSFEAKLKLILTQIHKIFPNSGCGLFFFDPENNSFHLCDAVINDLDASDFPESLAREAALRKHLTVSTELPPSLFLPETSNRVACTLLDRDELIGMLVVDLHNHLPMTNEQKSILIILSQLISAEMRTNKNQKTLQADLERKSEELVQLRKAGLVISSRLELKETLDSILRMAMEVTCARYGIFRLTDHSGKNLITTTFAGESLSNPITKTLEVGGNTITGWVAEHRTPICIPDLRQHPWQEMYYPLVAMLEMRSELAVPLIGASGRLEGVLNLESPEVGGFNDQDSHLLQSLATQAVIAIQETKLLDALRGIAGILLEQPTLQALDQIVDHAQELVNSNTCSIWLVQSDQVQRLAWVGEENPPDLLPLFDSIPGRVVQDRTIISGSIEETGHFPGLSDTSMFLAVPLLTADERGAFGALVVTFAQGHNDSHELSDWDRKVLQNLAQYASLAIQNARRQEELQAVREKQAIAETFAMVGDITANVLHQLNNKLGTIPVRIQGIRYKREKIIRDDDYIRRNLEEIKSSANEAMESVRLNLSNLRPIDVTAVGVNDSAQTAIHDLNIPSGIEIHLNRLDLLPPVRSGSRSLVLIFQNLIENAIEAIGTVGYIEISGDRDGKKVVISVKDSGPGIPTQIQTKIFDANFTHRNNPVGSKLGFGLWWVRTLLLRQGGSIRVESDGKHGSTFTLTIPVYEG